MSEPDEPPEIDPLLLGIIMEPLHEDKDRFGFRTRHIFFESPSAKQRREREAVKLVEDCFQTAVRNLGETAARALWKRVSSKRPGRPSGSSNGTRDDQILQRYYSMLEQSPDSRRSLPAALARSLHEQYPGVYGQSQLAIEKHIRRLLVQESLSSQMSWSFRNKKSLVQRLQIRPKTSSAGNVAAPVSDVDEPKSSAFAASGGHIISLFDPADSGADGDVIGLSVDNKVEE
jgi:hypothetical protein